MAGHVADDQRDLAIIERDHIEPVTAHLRGPAGRPIAVGDLQPRHLRDAARQQAALQGAVLSAERDEEPPQGGRMSRIWSGWAGRGSL